MESIPNERDPAYAGWEQRIRPFPRFPRSFFLGFAGGRFYRCSCDKAEGPRCSDLITNPAWVFYHRANEPDHVSDYVMQETVERWARSFVIAGTFDFEPGTLPPQWWEPGTHPAPQGGELALQAWQRTWPIILGKAALHRAISAGDFPPDSAPQRLFNVIPFEGHEYGALICSAAFDGTVVNFFAIVVPEYGNTDSPMAFRGGPAAFRIAGLQPDSPDVRRFVDHARRWWSTYGGQSIRRGRPAGSVMRSVSWYLEQYRNLATELKREPTQEAFCTRYEVDRKTLRENLKTYGCWPWERFKERARARTVRR